MMKKGMRKGRCIIGIIAVLVMVLCMGAGFTSRAGTLYESPYVSFTPDPGKYAWTVAEEIDEPFYLEVFYTNEKEPPSYWYPKGERIETGITSSLRELRVGEHYYDTKRMGEVPVKYWEVWHPMGGCVHNDCTEPEWHGVPNVGVNGNGNPCDKAYYSGWFAYCADCNQQLTHALVYMSRDAARSITSVDMNKGYFYRCPTCKHIENTVGVIPHMCKAISFNQYRVIYDKNDNGTDTVLGLMDASLHMYNNEDVYEGEQITPITRLYTNVYRRQGYAFAGWNTEPDGSGIQYNEVNGVGAEIFNLTAYDHNIDPERGTVTLYAQWVESKSILTIDPNGGAYDGRKVTKAIQKSYGDTYYVDPDKITPPTGCKVTYDLQGGAFKEETDNPALVNNIFLSWKFSEPFYGKMRDNTYAFLGPDGSTDILTAQYVKGSLFLPDAKKEDYAFGGWFEDKECTKPVGFAGQEYTPEEDTTLYAQWVNLVLYSKENYKDNDKKGAVDLSWSQKDSLAKSYKLYESADGKNFTLLYGAKKTIDLDSLAQNFAYKGATQTYTVQYSGFYELTAYGGQGGNYTRVLSDGSAAEYIGGKGGKVTARVYLTAGEVLTVAVGGRGGSNGANQGGYSGGGKGSEYGSGGGVTFIRSDKKGTLLMAGGGGGAGATANGGAGGAQERPRTDKKTSGEDGHAGGGAGYIGGQKGEYVVHHHVNECYIQDDALYPFTGFSTENTFAYWGGRGVPSISSTGVHFQVHTDETGDGIGSGNNQLYVNVGSAANPIPTNGHTKLSIPLYFYSWGEKGYILEKGELSETEPGGYFKVFDQDGATLMDIDMSKEYKTGTHGVSSDAYYIGSEENPEQYVVDLKEGTTGVYMALYLPIHPATSGVGSEITLKLGTLCFSGGVKLTCIYQEGEVLSSKPGYGGSSYVSTSHAVSYQMSPGVREGHGAAAIKAVSVGYMNTLSLEGVPAPDLAAPDKINTEPGKITKKADGDAAVKVTFEAPKDNGTPYWYRAESYKDGTEEKLCDSNHTSKTLTTGVAGYYYIVDTNPTKTVTASNADNKGNLLEKEEKKNTGTVPVLLTADTMYLHVAAVDVAGNIGPTADIEVSVEDQAWPIVTDQISVTDVINGVDKDTVYQKDANTFYVRADGTAPFLMSYRSFLDGKARADYQIDYQIFDVVMTEGKNQRYITRIPYSVPISSEAKLAVSDFVRQMSGDSILKDAMNTGAYRKRDSKDNYFYQAFAIPKSFHGKTMVVTPVAGASFKEEIQYSEWSDDITHSVTLIADGEAPEFQGLEILENRGMLEQKAEKIALQVLAKDTLSGVREFWIEIRNEDNYSTKKYLPDAQGKIPVEISTEEKLFHGDYTITVYGMDQVGNEAKITYEITELALEAKVERILVPHEPLFKRGESGILTITTWGYAERIEVEFPEEFTRLNPQLNQVYYLDTFPQYRQEKQLQFMVPLAGPTNQGYTVTVRAYKGERMLEEFPALSIVEGVCVLDELRTRLR